MDKNIEKYKLVNGINKMKSLGNILLTISFICLMMIFVGVLVFVWYWKIGFKIVISSIVIMVFSEFVRKAVNQLHEDYIKKLKKLLNNL